MTKRIESLDSFRIIAAFLVVSLHVNWPIESIGRIMSEVARIAVPYFLMVSGFFYKPERVWPTIKKLLLYTVIAVIIYLIVELLVFRSTVSIIDDLSCLLDYRFWICNKVPFCFVAWYLMSYIYILVITWVTQDNPLVQFILGSLSLLFAFGSGVYSDVLGLDGFNSVMWNCCFLSTYCWFALGRLLKRKRMKNGSFIAKVTTDLGGQLFDYMISAFLIVCIVGQLGEHYLLKIITSCSVNGTTSIFILPTVMSLFVLLIRHPGWNVGFKIGQLPLFIFLSHVAIHYVLVMLFWPWKFGLNYDPVIRLPFEPRLIVNNITVFILACVVFSIGQQLATVIQNNVTIKD